MAASTSCVVLMARPSESSTSPRGGQSAEFPGQTYLGALVQQPLRNVARAASSNHPRSFHPLGVPAPPPGADTKQRSQHFHSLAQISCRAKIRQTCLFGQRTFGQESCNTRGHRIGTDLHLLSRDGNFSKINGPRPHLRFILLRGRQRSLNHDSFRLSQSSKSVRCSQP